MVRSKKEKNKLLTVLVAVTLIVSMALSGCGAGGSNGGAETGTGAGTGAGTEDDASVNSDVQEETAGEESEPAGEAYEGTTIELLQSVISEANTGIEAVIDYVTPENAPAILGLLADDFASYVAEAAAATSESDGVAFQAAIVLCRYADDAGMINGLIQEGFDPGKWVYVFPDRALTSVAGPYILLAVGNETEADALAAAFKNTIDGTASTKVFYEGETGG